MEKVSELVPRKFFKQFTKEEWKRNYKLNLSYAKTEIEKTLISIEYEGGNCPFCKKSYKPYKSRIFKDPFYLPDCNCLKKKEMVKKIKCRMLTAGVPKDFLNVSLTGWNTSVTESVLEAYNKVKEYVLQKEWEKNRGIVIYGDVGTGKTHLLVAVLRQILISGLKIRFESMSNILDNITRKKNIYYLDGIYRSKAVLFDDIDKLSISTDKDMQRVFGLFDRMTHNNKIILATANFKTPEDIYTKFGEAIISRLNKNCNFIFIQGDDYRMKGKENNGNN